VGINQIYDVDIDKTNKPFLPVAAGEGGRGSGRLRAGGEGCLLLTGGVLHTIGAWGNGRHATCIGDGQLH
jgi:4-hydroxybenzoate polyprenyltransferase